jgi:hypothetical protein
VLEAGDCVPEVEVWTAPREEAQPLKNVLGGRLSVLCFYLYEWSRASK